MFTRQHYVAIATVLREHIDGARSDEYRASVVQVAHALAILFRQDNEQFDRDRFLKASGVGS